MNGQQRYEEDAIVSCKGHRAVNIEAIPTTTELRLSCSQNSSELTFQLQTVQKGIVSISFVWDGVWLAKDSRAPLRPKEFALGLNDEIVILSLALAGRVNSAVLASSLRNYFESLCN